MYAFTRSPVRVSLIST